MDETVAFDAISLVRGDRSRYYDSDKRTSLEEVADLWSAYLDTTISAVDVSAMMTLLKIARSKQRYKRDNYVDAVGYLLLAEQAHREKK